MLNNIQFEYPYVLLLIILFIIADIFFKAKSATYYIPHIKQFQEASATSNFLRYCIKYVAIIFAIISLASPIKTSHTQNIKKDGINIVLSLDTSGSMKAIGFNRNKLEQNRWQAVQSIVKPFIEKRVNDNIALVVFGSSVLTASPLSFDNDAQQEILDYLDIGIIGDKTAMIDSLAASINILKDKPAKSNIIILLTDGEDTASITPYSVITKMAQKYNIKIYTVGIGESNRLLLNQIATQTGAKSFEAYTKEHLEAVYQTIDQLEKTKIDADKIILKEYYFFYPLFVSLIALSIYIFLINKE